MKENSQNEAQIEQTADILEPLDKKRQQLDAIARQLAEDSGFDILDDESSETDESFSLETGNPSFNERLEHFLTENTVASEFDLESLAGKIAELENEMHQHSEKVLCPQALERFQSLEVGGRPLVDLTHDEVEQWIKSYKEQGNFEAADILAQAYAEFIRELNQKAVEGHLFRQKQETYQDLKARHDWKQVEHTYLEKFPELKEYVPHLTQYLNDRFLSDPLSPYTNKYVLVRDAIDSLELGKHLDKSDQSNAIYASPDADISRRRVLPSSLNGKKNYRLSEIKAMDYRRMSPDDLRDMQQAMFEGRISED